LESPFWYQDWAIAYIEEAKRTRCITWVIDLVGNTGKSLLVSALENDPRYGVLRIPVDSYDRFKFNACICIDRYKKELGEEPRAIILDPPRNEEDHNLHTIYPVLEEINNGRVESSFGGVFRQIKLKRGTPILVFTNSPPVQGGLSPDRWDIKALYKSEAHADILIQDCCVEVEDIHTFKNNFISWRNKVVFKDLDETKLSGRSGIIIREMLASHKDFNSAPPVFEREVRPRQSHIAKAPGYIQEKALEKINRDELLNKN